MQTKEEIAAYRKAYYKANKKKLTAHCKAYYETNKKKLAAGRKSYREVDKEKRAVQKPLKKGKCRRCGKSFPLQSWQHSSLHWCPECRKTIGYKDFSFNRISLLR